MPVTDKHPNYNDRIDEWTICEDALRGQQAVKEAGERYLPKPSGFANNPDRVLGDSLYAAYLYRAEFYDVYSLTLRGMVGLIHRQEAQIKGIEGTELAKLHESCTRPGSVPALTLMAFHEQITERLLHKGRSAVLVEAASKGSDVPYFALYDAEAVTNWSPDGSLYVLNESGLVRSTGDEFAWIQSEKYRVLRLIDGEYIGQVYSDRDTTSPEDPEGQLLPRPPASGQGVAGGPPVAAGPTGTQAPGTQGTKSTLSSGATPYTPKARGGRSMDRIPLTIGGPVKMGLDPASPPLLGVARAALAMYRLDADYRHQLFMSGQETLFISGATPAQTPKVVGAGVIVGVPTGVEAKYVSPSCVGISAHKTAIADESSRAIAAGVQLFDQGGGQQSGDALRLRYGAQTATLITIARQSASILESSLRHAGRMIGMSEKRVSEITVVPNLEFLETVMTPSDAASLVTVWQSGAISYETLYENFIRGGIASGERTAEEEQELIDEETPDQPALGQGTDPAAPGAASLGTTTDAGTSEDVADPSSEDGPDSITDEELSATFGDYADDVVAGGGR